MGLIQKLMCIWRWGFFKSLCYVYSIYYENTLQTITYFSSFPPICWYPFLAFVLNFMADILRLHFSKQTGAKPGWSVMHFSWVPASKSAKTMSLSSDSLHFSSSAQQRSSSGVSMKASEQWPHLHLKVRCIYNWKHCCQQNISVVLCGQGHV